MNSLSLKKNSYLVSHLSQKHYIKNAKENKDKTMIILHDSYHMVLYDNEKEFVFDTVGKFIDDHSKIKECVIC